MDAAAADGGHDAAPAAPKVDVGEPPGGLGPGFGAGHLDTTTMFDAGVGALTSTRTPAKLLDSSLTRVANRFAKLGYSCR